MSAENMLGFMIYLLVALFMIGIGVSQVKSKKTVGFYSGEKPPKEEELTNVHEWNKKHGMIWISYGVVIILSYFVGIILGDTIWSAITMVGGVVIPIIFMIRYHHKLIKEYKK